MGTYLGNYINEGLGIVSRELPDPLNLDVVREDRGDQRDAVVYGKGMTDQVLPSRVLAAYEEPCQVKKCTIVGTNKKPTA